MQISVRLLQLPAFSTPLKVIENPFFYQLLHFAGSIDVPEKSTIKCLCAKVTEHMLSGTCTSFANPSHPPISLPNGLRFPDCRHL
jgi:hypothetical protein